MGDDVVLAVSWLRANAQTHNLDESKFILVGISGGGHLVALAGAMSNTNSSGRVAGAIDAYGFTNVTSLAEDLAANGCDPPDYTQIIDGLGCDPEICTEDAKDYSPVTHINPESAEFLILQGTEDCLVAPLQSQRMHNAVLAAGVSSTLVLVEGAGHSVTQVIANDDTLVAINAFVDEIRCRSPPSLPPLEPPTPPDPPPPPPKTEGTRKVVEDNVGLLIAGGTFGGVIVTFIIVVVCRRWTQRVCRVTPKRTVDVPENGKTPQTQKF